MELFEHYENNYVELTNSINERINRIPTKSGDDKRKDLEEAEDEIASAEATLASMGLQARSLSPPHREGKTAIVRRFENQLTDLKSSLKQVKQAAINAKNRETLFDGSGVVTEMHVSSLENRDRLVQTTYRMEENTERIRQMNETLAATGEVAEDILQELSDQRTTMQRMLDSLRDINGTLDSARSVMRSMSYRFVCNKMVLIGIALVIILIILGVIFVRFFWDVAFSGNSSDSSSSMSFPTTTTTTTSTSTTTTSGTSTSGFM